MKKSIAGLVLFAASFAASALPTTQQVEAAVQQGNYAQAESMMSEVVAAKPESARAHYVYAEMLAHNGRFAKAADEARRAREIDPAIKFTEAGKFQAFEQLLQRERSTPANARVAPSPAPGMAPAAPMATAPARQGLSSWIWLGALALIAFMLWRMFARRAAAAPAGGMGAGGAMGGTGPMNPGPYNPNMPYNPNTPYGPNAGPGMQGGAGRGMLGTGLAVAGGVAGGMLLDRMLHNHGGGSDALGNVGPGGASGLNPAASELESRPVDFGTGNDWDSGGTSDAGSSDAGGSDGGGWD